MTVTNTYEPKVSLSLSKDVEGRVKAYLNDGDNSELYEFEIYVAKPTDASDTFDTTVDYAVTVTQGENDEAVTGDLTANNISGNAADGYYITFAADSTYANYGKATVKLADGQKITLSGLPKGYSYKIKELNNDGYVTDIFVDGQEQSGTTPLISRDAVNDDEAVTYVNKINSLMISKSVNAENANSNQSFSFTVRLTDNSRNPITGAISCTLVKGTTVQTNFTKPTFDSNGEATISLKDGESILFYGLPDGYLYTVTEAAAESYQARIQTVVDNVVKSSIVGSSVTAMATGTDIDINVTNQKVYDLVLQKTVEGQFANLDRKFQFEITLKDAEGQPVSGDYEVVLSDGVDISDSSLQTKEETIEIPDGKGILLLTQTTSTITFTGGKATVYLKHGQSVRIKEIPENYTYQMVELGASDSGYETSIDIQTSQATMPTTISGSDTGAQSLKTYTTVTYTNTLPDVPSTGNHTDYAPLTVGFILLVLLAGVAAFFWGKRRKYGKPH
jgi:LPXTG-motif cell wall-anchored protein